MLPAANCGLAGPARGSSGPRARTCVVSTARAPTTNTTAETPTTRRSACSLPACMATELNPPTTATMATWGPRCRRPGAPGPGGTGRTTSTSAAAQIGTLIANTAGQPSVPDSNPPTTGPKLAAVAPTAPQTPIALARAASSE